MSPRAPRRPGTQRGFTLLEMIVALAVSAVLMTLAVPTYADFAARHRLAAATQGLALDLQAARLDAVQRGEAMHVNFTAGPQWCYAVSADPACDCTRAGDACIVRRGDAQDYPGVVLERATGVSFDARQGRSAAGRVADFQAGGRFASEVWMHPLGRPRVCASGAPIGSVPACR